MFDRTATSELKITRHARIDEIAAGDWNALVPPHYPFLRHEYLTALEQTGCVGYRTGWQPRHICAFHEGQLVGAMPLYLKTHSRGEYVFDFSWADAYARHGIPYYPKLVNAIPFTPVPGSRMLSLHDARNRSQIETQLVDAAIEYAQDEEISSWHCLFPSDEQRLALADTERLLTRKSYRFLWQSQNWTDFDAFLGAMTASKRKKAKRERRRIAESGVRIESLSGAEITPDLWANLFPLYARTFLIRGTHPYMNPPFFEQISRTMGEQMRIFVARHHGDIVACNISFEDQDTLYGRYWGSREDYHSLHFELCYYQGIEYCLASNRSFFDPGTQGEHKLSRGFLPVYDWSAHWIGDRRFRAAIGDFVNQEQALVDRYLAELREHSPFRQDDTP